MLENIDRPDVGWDEHLKIITELKEAFPDRQSKVQLIQGLPGQNLQTWRQTLSEIAQHNVLLYPFVSELLPASPAARNAEYQEKFKFKYSTSERLESGHFFRGTMPESCISFTQRDFVEMTLLTAFYTTLLLYISRNIKNFDMENVVNDFVNSDNYKILADDLYTNWHDNDKFYFTMDLDLTPGIVTASNFPQLSNKWLKSRFLLKLITANIKGDRKQFIKNMLKVNNGRHEINIESLEGWV